MILVVGLNPALQRILSFARFTHGEINRPVSVKEIACGKGINVARTLSILGEEVLVTGFLGGRRKKLIKEMLACEGILNDFVGTASETRIATTLIDRKARRITELPETGGKVTKVERAAFLKKFRELSKKSSMVIFSGTAPPGTGTDIYKVLMKDAHKQDINTIVDAGGEYLENAFAGNPAVIKANKNELEAALGRKLRTVEIPAAVSDLLGRKTKWAFVTLGKAGAMIVKSNSCWRIRSPSIKVINSTGCGDAMTAGIAYALARKMSNNELIKFSIACGTANALTLFPGEVKTEEISRLQDEITIERCNTVSFHPVSSTGQV